MSAHQGSGPAPGLGARWRALAGNGPFMGRLLLADLAVALAALLAVVALGDPGGSVRSVEVGGGRGEVQLQGRDPAPFGQPGIDPGSAPGDRPSGAPVDGAVAPAPRPGPAGAAPAPGGGLQAPQQAGAAEGPAPSPRAGPARDGTYRYQTSSTSADGEESDEHSLTYRTTDRSDGETRQTVEGHGSGTEWMSPSVSGGDQRLVWREDGLFIDQSESPDGMPGSSCEPAEHLYIRMPLAAGRSWESTSRCEFGFGDFSGRVSTRTTTTVAGHRATVVGGRSVPAWELRIVTDVEGEMTGEDGTERFQGRIEQVQLFATSHGLVVEAYGSYRAVDPDGTEDSGTFSARLLHLDPT